MSTQVAQTLVELDKPSLSPSEPKEAKNPSAAQKATIPLEEHILCCNNEDDWQNNETEFDEVVVEYRLRHLQKNWDETEVDFTNDLKTFLTLPPATQRFYLTVGRILQKLDDVVQKKLVDTSDQMISRASVIQTFLTFAAREAVHSRTYNLMFNAIKPQVHSEYKAAMEAYEALKIEERVLDWYNKNLSSKNLAERLNAFALGEGVGFASLFHMIFALTGSNILPGWVESNSMISSDETDHLRHACYLYLMGLVNKLTEEENVEQTKSFVDLWISITQDIYGYDDQGNPIKSHVIGDRVLYFDESVNWIKHCANDKCKKQGLKTIPYPNLAPPSSFMNAYATEQDTNFFEAHNRMYVTVGHSKHFSTKFKTPDSFLYLKESV